MDYELDSLDTEVLIAFAKGQMRMRQASLITGHSEITVKNRLNRIKAKTGVDPFEFCGLSELVNMCKGVDGWN